MTREFLLLRHAKSSWDGPAQTDHARPLNAAGQEAAVAMRPILDQSSPPDLILVSSARRTLQTLQALGPFPDSTLVSQHDDLYLAPLPRLLHILHEVAPATGRVLLIGHNPGLAELALTLAEGQEMGTADPGVRRLADGFPTGALAVFTVLVPWRQLGIAGGTRLLRFVTPRDVRESAT